MHLFLFFPYLVQFILQEHPVHGQSACLLQPIDKKVRRIEYKGRYYLGDDLMTQPEAEQCCKSKNLTLATITSDEDSALLSRLYSLAPRESENGEKASGTPVWVSSDSQIKKDMVAVGDGPCSTISIEVYLLDFTRIVKEGSACEAKKKYLCEDRNMGKVQAPPPATEEFGTGSMYSKTKVRWAEAKTFCSEKKKILLNSLTENEKDSILQHIEKTEEGKVGVWTGGFKDPNLGYQWSTGFAIETNIEKKDENNCVKLVVENAAERKFSYVTEECTSNLPFICLEKIVPAEIKEMTAEVGRNLDTKTAAKRPGGPIGPDLTKDQKQACMAEVPTLVENTNTLYCMRQNFSWRQAVSCCRLKGMAIASFRTTEEPLPVFACSTSFSTLREDVKYRGPWTSGNNFQTQEYHWYNGTRPEDEIKDDIWVDIWESESDKGQCVHFHGTNKSETGSPNHNSKNPQCKDNTCWGLITADCYRGTTFVCRTDSPVTPNPSVSTTASPPGGGTTGTPPGGATTGTPPGGETTGTPPGGETTATPPGGETTATPPGGATTGTPPGGATTATPPGGETTAKPAVTTIRPPGVRPTPGPIQCPPRPTIAPCHCEGESTFTTENQNFTIDTKFGITYTISKTKETFFQSIQSCRKLNSSLLAIEFPAENKFVRQHRRDLDNDLWTSGVTTKTGRLIQWLGTGRYLHYHPNEWKPDVTEDKCLAIGDDGIWTLSECKTKNYYMCEFRVR